MAEETVEDDEKETTVIIIIAVVGGVIALLIACGCIIYCNKKSDHIKVLNDGNSTGKENEMARVRLATPTESDVFNTNNN